MTDLNIPHVGMRLYLQAPPVNSTGGTTYVTYDATVTIHVLCKNVR